MRKVLIYYIKGLDKLGKVTKLERFTVDALIRLEINNHDDIFILNNL